MNFIDAILPILSFLAAVVAVAAFYIQLKKELKDSNYSKGIDDGLIKCSLSHIRTQLDEVNAQMKQFAQSLNQINEKLARVDESVKSAHKRISGLRPD